MTAVAGRPRSRGINRLRRGRVEAERDREVLEWIGRFRFVTAAVLAERFAVSTRQMNVRLARLAHEGLVTLHREHVGQARAVYLSRSGSALLGHRPRRVPRPDVQRRHELAIAQLVAWLEDPTQPRGYEVLTERECHRREADGERGLSVRLQGGERRWADLVLVRAQSRDAVELEFAAKTTERLSRILDGYLHSDYARVFLYVDSVALGRRLTALADRRSEQARAASRRPEVVPKLIVEAWMALRDDRRAEVAQAIVEGR